MGLKNYLKHYFSVAKQTEKIIRFLDANFQRGAGGHRYYGDIHVYPKYPWSEQTFYDLRDGSTPIRTIFRALKGEIFRNGYDIKEGIMTDETTTDMQQKVTPDKKDEIKIHDFLERCNDNGQDIIDVFEEIEEDWNVKDDGWMQFLFNYKFGSGGKLTDQDLNQVLRIHPGTMGKVMNRYDVPGMDDNHKKLYVCPEHRGSLIVGESRCGQCRKEPFPAHYFQLFGSERMYFAPWEFVHRSKFQPSKRLGVSPFYALWYMVRTLIYMDYYMMQSYQSGRPPKGLLVFNTPNMSMLRKMNKDLSQFALEHPNTPAIIGAPSSSNSGDFVKFIDYMKSNPDLQYIEQRKEFWEKIGAFYGVEPLFHGDLSTSGGLNNEGQQITVTNRTIETEQTRFNKYYLRPILRYLKTPGWVVELNPSEEQDQMAKLERQRQTLDNGRTALSLGLEAEYDKDTGEVMIQSGKLESSGFDPFANIAGNPSETESADEPSGAPADPESDITKDEVIKANLQPPFTKLSNSIKKIIDKFLKKFEKTKPSTVELSNLSLDIRKNMLLDIQDSTKDMFKSTYTASQRTVGKELGVGVAFGQPDQNALSVLENQQVLTKAYQGLTNKISNQINDVIRKSFADPKLFTLDNLTKQITDISKVADFRAERIARTETTKVANAARRLSYQKADPDNKFVYKWIGPQDNRTTGVSKNIKSRTAKGVSYDELVKIVTEESSKEFPTWTVNKDFPVSHWNSRHTFIRVVSL